MNCCPMRAVGAVFAQLRVLLGEEKVYFLSHRILSLLHRGELTESDQYSVRTIFCSEYSNFGNSSAEFWVEKLKCKTTKR